MTFVTVVRNQIATQQVMRSRAKKLRWQRFRETLIAGLAVVVVSVILCGKNLSAQTHAQTHALLATKPAQQKAAAEPAQPNRPSPEAMTSRPASPAPIWPANPPNQAKVTWDGRGLEIEASNSSLNQILQQVAADTGAKLEGFTQDQRVFGSYGPGPGSDVLWKLLDGFGYNVLMVGGRDAEAPLEIVLSARSPASLQTTANNQNRSNSQDDEDARQPEPEAPGPQPVQNPYGNGGAPPRDPVQFMQEVLQRQQKIDQQQQNQQNNPQQ